jgi:hypothetical protein
MILWLAKKEFHFVSTPKYFIAHNGEMSLVSFNKSKLFSIIKSTEVCEEWLKSKKNKLKSEADVVAFLDFCESLRTGNE